MRNPAEKFLVITTAVQLVIGSVAASAQNSQKDRQIVESCSSMLDRIDADLARADEERAGLKSEMSKLAKELPLLVEMSDGSFVYLEGEEKLSEPIESWFASENALRDKSNRSSVAREHLVTGDEVSCIAALKEADEISN